MYDIPLGKKSLPCFTNISEPIVPFYFWVPMHEKHFKQGVITYLVVSPVWAMTIKNPDYISIVTCMYLNFPNPET